MTPLHYAKLHVAMLDVYFELFVGSHEQIYEATEKLTRYRGHVEKDDSYRGLSIKNNHGYFAILLKDGGLTHELIAHEILHHTLNIWDYLDEHTKKKNSEPLAYLCGYLTRWTYKQLINNKFTITNK